MKRQDTIPKMGTGEWNVHIFSTEEHETGMGNRNAKQNLERRRMGMLTLECKKMFI